MAGDKLKSPAFQFYVADWLSSERVALMSLEEEGAYIRLLCYCWKNGSIPNNIEDLAYLIGKGASTTLAEKLKTMFEIDPKNSKKLINFRQEIERKKQKKWREKSREGGIKSGKSRKKKQINNKMMNENNNINGSTTLGRVVPTTLEPPFEPKGNTISSSSTMFSSINTFSSSKNKKEKEYILNSKSNSTKVRVFL